jgi:hypothetical protein
MRSKILDLVLVMLLASCSHKEIKPIIIYPLKIDFYGETKQLTDQLEKRGTQLVYENSFPGEDIGVKLYYFDDENDSLHYHFEINTISDRIEGIKGSISSNSLSEERLYGQIEKKIIPEFKTSANKLLNVRMKCEKRKSNDVRGETPYYYFELKTKDLLKKMQ